MADLAKWVVEQMLVSEEQLGRARELQRQTGVPLAMALIELELVDEKALVDLVAAKHNLPKAPRRLHKLDVPPKALSLIPQDYCWQYNAFPFGLDVAARKLQLAIVDPADAEALEALRKIARLELSLFVAGPRQIEKGIRRHYLDSWVDETNAPQKRLRYFGYENITNPGVEPQARRPPTPASEEAAPPPVEIELPPAATPLGPPLAAAPLGPTLPPLQAAPAAPVEAAPTLDSDLEWESAEDDPSAPVLKSVPTLPSRPVGRIQASDPLAEVMIRLDRLERVVEGLLEVLGQSSSSIASLRESLKSPRR